MKNKKQGLLPLKNICTIAKKVLPAVEYIERDKHNHKFYPAYWYGTGKNGIMWQCECGQIKPVKIKWKGETFW